MLGVGVVDGNDGKAQHSVVLHGAQPDDAGRRLFGRTDHVFDQVLTVLVKTRDHVGAVVDYDVWPVPQGLLNVPVIRFAVFAFDGEDLKAIGNECRGDIILR